MGTLNKKPIQNQPTNELIGNEHFAGQEQFKYFIILQNWESLLGTNSK